MTHTFLLIILVTKTKSRHMVYDQDGFISLSLFFAIFKISECTDGAEKVVWQLTKSAWILKK